ncbi:MAG: tig, trigger factor, trigger factor [Patescibacteria group bacterium]|nr:tig, trigger factor, trigger factor [Patescibacteria group bacterium]
MKPEIKPLDRSRIEISGTVPAEKFESYRDRAIAAIGRRVKIDGFREGKVPANMIEKHVGEMGILEQMAELAISDAYPTVIIDNKIEAIGRPEIHIKKIAKGNDLEFSVITAVVPKIDLGDYKKIAKSTNKETISVEVTDDEVDGSIKELRQMRAHHLMHEHGHDHTDHNHANIEEKDLPALDDEFVKTLGAFESVEDFKTKLRENLAKEKTRQENEKKRITMIDGIIEGASIDLPDLLVDIELDKMMSQFAYDISMTGMTMDDYLKRIEKTEDALKAEWRINAEKRAKMQLILDKVAEDEKLEPNQEEIQSETAKILEMYKDAQDVSEERVRAYVTQILTNAKAFEYLEGLK